MVNHVVATKCGQAGGFHKVFTGCGAAQGTALETAVHARLVVKICAVTNLAGIDLTVAAKRSAAALVVAITRRVASKGSCAFIQGRARCIQGFTVANLALVDYAVAAQGLTIRGVEAAAVRVAIENPLAKTLPRASGCADVVAVTGFIWVDQPIAAGSQRAQSVVEGTIEAAERAFVEPDTVARRPGEFVAIAVFASIDYAVAAKLSVVGTIIRGVIRAVIRGVVARAAHTGRPDAGQARVAGAVVITRLVYTAGSRRLL